MEMKLANILQESTFKFIHTVSENSFNNLDNFLSYNLPLIEKFSNVAVSYNTSDEKLNKEFVEYLKAIVPNIDLHYTLVNNLHTFGTIDLDEVCLTRAKEEGFKYLWKGTSDFLVNSSVLDLELPEDFEFAYLPGFSYETLFNAGGEKLLVENYELKTYAPQSNFFIIKVDSVNSLYGPSIEEKKSVFLELQNKIPNIRPWEIEFSDGIKFACEDLLGYTTKNLNKRNLLDYESFLSLAKFVNTHKVGDPSHKNMFLDSTFCHFHSPKNGVYYV